MSERVRGLPTFRFAMRPEAVVAATIEIVETLEAGRAPLKAVLAEWGRAHRFAGSKDRARIAELAYAVARHWERAASRMDETTARARILGTLALAEPLEAVEALFAPSKYGPAPLTEPERARLAEPSGPFPERVAAEVPEELWPLWQASFGADAQAEAEALIGRAPVDLRVNTLRAQPDGVIGELDFLGLVPEPGPFPESLRLGAADLAGSDLMDSGAIEIQDWGSQIAARIAAPAPGETVVDLCAGAGGKTLAAAALMAGEGTILAADPEPRRLDELERRAARAGADIVRRMDAQAIVPASADLVILDVPCSGTGTWRRQPDLRARTGAADIDRYRAVQSRLLADGARLVRPGGRLAYVTCSMLAAENEDQIRSFLAEHPGWMPRDEARLRAPLNDDWRARPLASAPGLQLTPRATATDGFYVAVLDRAPQGLAGIGE